MSTPRFRSLDDPDALRSFVKNLREAIYITNERGDILDGNPAFFNLLGVRSLNELHAYGANELVVDPARRLAQLEIIEREGSIRDYELQLVRPDGTLPRTMREQTQQLLENIREVLRREGGTMDDIVRVRVYATQVDAASLRDIHEVRSTFWTQGTYPASTLVRVSQLIRDGALIEIDADAVIATS